MHAERLLVISVEEMVVKAAKRYFELRRLCDHVECPDRETLRQLKVQRDALERLVVFRAALLTERLPGGRGPAAMNARQVALSRDELTI